MVMKGLFHGLSVSAVQYLPNPLRSVFPPVAVLPVRVSVEVSFRRMIASRHYEWRIFITSFPWWARSDLNRGQCRYERRALTD